MVNITGWLTVWNIFQMKRLRKLGLFSLENSEDIMGKNGDEGSRLFSEVPCDRTRGNQHKLKEIEFNLNTKKKCFFVVRDGVKHRHRLSRDTVESRTLKIFKSHLEMVLGTLLRVSLLQQGLDQMGL